METSDCQSKNLNDGLKLTNVGGTAFRKRRSGSTELSEGRSERGNYPPILSVTMHTFPPMLRACADWPIRQTNIPPQRMNPAPPDLSGLHANKV